MSKVKTIKAMRVGKCFHCGKRRQLHKSGYCLKDCHERYVDEQTAIHGVFVPCGYREVRDES